MKARPEETDDSGSTKCDYRRILVARAQRRRPKGVRAREASALETIRLVLPNVKPSPSAGVFRLKARPEETDDSGSTKCDYRSILVARAQRRRPKGVRAREASALETIRLVLPNVKPSPSAGVFRLKARPEETDDSGSTKCDYRSILVARAQRRRPKGVRAREASALETIRLVLPKSKTRLQVGFLVFEGSIRFGVVGRTTPGPKNGHSECSKDDKSPPFP